MVEAFERNHVRVAGPLNAQHDEMNVLVLSAPFQMIETTVEFRGRAEEQFTFQIVEHHRRTRPILRDALAYDAVAAHHQLVPTQQRGTRNKHQNRQGYADQNGKLNTDEDRSEGSNQN